ncbi:hypothetical protein [Synechococcus sp. MIT S9509]|uniref:hypothetical protein n=1 Tax=Synechococcus sp. MIT S9509 TaxID=1801630 RepID=UPI0012E96272|nr:hypothetical protein [Synechococcus sp. MIT S9509]
MSNALIDPQGKHSGHQRSDCGNPEKAGSQIRHTPLLTTTNVDVNRGFINLCCNLGGTESATSIGATKEQGLPGAVLSVASPILRLFLNLASSPDAVPHDRLYSVMQFG